MQVLLSSLCAVRIHTDQERGVAGQPGVVTVIPPGEVVAREANPCPIDGLVTISWHGNAYGAFAEDVEQRTQT
ncbi:MAG TPA: hypothetical protein VKU01_33005 [Bryobacteraceae bacterium]|nr:hypothetical protein [Bryobacteraceae bacterium]